MSQPDEFSQSRDEAHIERLIRRYYPSLSGLLMPTRVPQYLHPRRRATVATTETHPAPAPLPEPHQTSPPVTPKTPATRVSAKAKPTPTRNAHNPFLGKDITTMKAPSITTAASAATSNTVWDKAYDAALASMNRQDPRGTARRSAAVTTEPTPPAQSAQAAWWDKAYDTAVDRLNTTDARHR